MQIGGLGDSLGHLAGYDDEKGLEYQGEDILEEKHLMKREKGGYDNVIHHKKQKKPR